MPFGNFHGNKRWWTRERTAAALKAAMAEIQGPLPCSDWAWNAFKKGRLEYPPATRVLEFYKSMARAWLAAGAPQLRVSLRNNDWLPAEDAYLLDHAGTITLAAIARHLGRTYQAARYRLERGLGVTARANQGYVSAAELAQEFKCSYHRIRRAIAAGTIKGFYDKKRNRWQIDMIDLDPGAMAVLKAPKVTHKSKPADLGDYEKRHNIRRKMINGKVVRFKLQLASISII
jgi:hypothetical protein